ncbi:phage tail assembly protein [Campylobacter sp.]|uniref:phage tail assembly protein n=1 Tax=Campylobacter sp. TaxID=205 RepID=UPI00259C7FC6|nr:phage tail assembly protein [Campylobacter sp.]MBQ3167891.1 phage tail assembly protein [Campylobacter sp.]MBQ7135623.1 phage tail assembly protein [Campylobacter sp.]
MKNNIIEENNEKYTVVTLSDKKEIKIRHPKGRDVRFMMSGGGQNDSDLLFRLTSNLTCLSEEELENMEAKDCTMLLKEVSSFLE